jgi:hypothetical protein
MQNGQLLAAIGISFGLAAGAVGGWMGVQRWQSATSGPASVDTVVPSASTQPAFYSQSGAAQLQSEVIPFSQAENDYLYDLAQALQSVEQRRLTDAERLAIGRQIADWLESGEDYWGVRGRFDQRYRAVIAGDYGQNRDAYIKFATERLAPGFIATLTVPPRIVTRTEYVETPGPTQVITVPSKPKVITVREPVPVVPHPHPISDPCSGYPDCPDYPGYPDRPDYPHYPDYPYYPDRPQHDDPDSHSPNSPNAEQPDTAPPPIAEEPFLPPASPDAPALPDQELINDPEPAPEAPRESLTQMPIQEVVHTEVQ